jgi:putative oxidoreductase
MSAPSRLARPLLASMFIYGGIDAVRNPASKVKAAEKVTAPLARQIDVLPEDPLVLVRLNGAVQVVSGALLAAGKFRRLAALALIGSIIPTTYAGHSFWNEVDDEVRAQQKIHFLKNLGLLGGLILAASDTEGAPSTAWRLQNYRNSRKSNRRSASTANHDRLVHLAHEASTIGSKALSNFEEIAAKEAVKGAHLANKGADLAGRLGTSGLQLGDAVRSQLQERIAAL